MPDIESRFYQPYKDLGLEVIGIDANGDTMTGVQEYLLHVPQTFPVGLEDPLTPTYKALVGVYKGLNPFPVDVLVGKNGNIAYVGREYDAESMLPIVEKLLAE